jgi:hypothetical protein
MKLEYDRDLAFDDNAARAPVADHVHRDHHAVSVATKS